MKIILLSLPVILSCFLSLSSLSLHPQGHSNFVMASNRAENLIRSQRITRWFGLEGTWKTIIAPIMSTDTSPRAGSHG